MPYLCMQTLYMYMCFYIGSICAHAFVYVCVTGFGIDGALSPCHHGDKRSLTQHRREHDSFYINHTDL